MKTGQFATGEDIWTDVEARDKVTGRAEYIHNLALPGMLHGKAHRSTVPHARAAAPSQTVERPQYEPTSRNGSPGTISGAPPVMSTAGKENLFAKATTASMVSRVMHSPRPGPASRWQCRHRRLHR